MLITAKDIEDFEMPQSVASIKDASTYVEEVKEAFLNPVISQGDHLPWPKTHDNLRFRPGEVSLWMGINGHGKSMLDRKSVV